MGGKIILLIGKSGSGKSTIADILNKDYGLKILQSYTTRKKRTPKETGHIFVTESQFKELDLVANTYFDENYYGASVDQIEENDVYIIDKKGVETIRYLYHGDKQLVPIYIKTSDKTRETRMKLRGTPPDEICKRLKNDEHMFNGIDSMVKAVLLNNKDTTANDIAKAILEIGRQEDSWKQTQ